MFIVVVPLMMSGTPHRCCDMMLYVFLSICPVTLRLKFFWYLIIADWRSRVNSSLKFECNVEFKYPKRSKYCFTLDTPSAMFPSFSSLNILKNDFNLFKMLEKNLLVLISLSHDGICLAITPTAAGTKDIDTDTSTNRKDNVKRKRKLLSALDVIFDYVSFLSLG